METHLNRTPAEIAQQQQQQNQPHQTLGTPPEEEFSPGTPVIYALHGKCNVVAVEPRQVGGESIRFYKLEVQKSSLSRSTRQEPAIWLPVSTAREKGLRSPLSQESAAAVLAVLSNREYYFSVSEPWSVVHPKLEASIRSEGAIGLAKVFSYLHVLKKKQIVPSTEVVRFNENVSKVLLRELSEALGEPIRAIEEKINKSLRQKLVPDH